MFVVFEGIDGCGKSTHAKLLAKWLESKGQRVYLTAEPTKEAIGCLIREILSGKMEVSPTALSLLFTADRAQHDTRISEALEDGMIVLCERYYHSTVAYQSAQGVARHWLLKINEFALEPDAVLYLDVDAESGAERTDTGEIFEKKEFLEKVKIEYSRFKQMMVFDSRKPVQEVQKQIREIIGGLL